MQLCYAYKPITHILSVLPWRGLSPSTYPPTTLSVPCIVICDTCIYVCSSHLCKWLPHKTACMNFYTQYSLVILFAYAISSSLSLSKIGRLFSESHNVAPTLPLTSNPLVILSKTYLFSESCNVAPILIRLPLTSNSLGNLIL